MSTGFRAQRNLQRADLREIRGKLPLGAIANSGPAHAIMQLQTASKFYYAVPAAMVAIALHRTRWFAIAIVLASLVAVYITMYDHGPLDVHLTFITCAVIAISLATFALVRVRATGT